MSLICNSVQDIEILYNSRYVITTQQMWEKWIANYYINICKKEMHTLDTIDKLKSLEFMSL